MSKNLIRHAALLVTAVLLSAGFWSCGKEDIPEPIPPTVAVTGVTLDKTSISLLVGDSETLTATVTPADAENQKLTWSSDKPAVATVDDNGKVTAVKVGTATITVTTEDGGKTATCRVTVKAATVAVTGVTLNKSTLSLIEGTSETLTATITPADATDKELTWTSSDATVATVDANGKVTAVKAGEATVTVTTRDGGKTATCRVTVSDREIKVTEITLAALAIYVGESKAITATVKPDDATNKALTWKSSDETVATVDATGKVTGKKIGTATITATARDGSGVSGSCTVTVLSPVKKVTVTPATMTLGKNKSYTLTATVDAQPGTDTGVTWTSSDTTIATVDATGKVTATDKTGTVTITATSKADPAKKGTCTVKVSGDQTDIGYGEYGPEEEW